jgi:uncharacterized protein YndB with AHSA1/START domain
MPYELRIERSIDASPEVVFDAFVDPDAQKELYASDDGDPTWVVESELDLRVGGTWVIEFGKAGDEPYRETNVFTEVDRPRRMVFDSTMSMGGGHTMETTVTLTFEDRDGKTLLTLVHTGFERREDRDAIQGGWPSILDALERVVASRRRER